MGVVLMGNLTVKEVEFNGDVLMAAQDKSNERVYVGVRWVSEGIGLTKGQMQNERKKIQEDLVLKQGERNLVLPTNSGEQEVLCIELDFLPLWLAKISITPKMRENSPFMVQKLVDYQLKAKDVLAEAFIKKEDQTVSSDLQFLQGLLDGMKANELQMKQIAKEQEEQGSKVVHIETELNKETLIEGQVNSNNIARELSIFSKAGKPHSQFIDAVAQDLKIYNNVVGYNDRFTKVIRETGRGGKITAVAYYSDEGVKLIEKYVMGNFTPQGKLYVRGQKKGQFNESSFELGGKTFKFNRETYNKHKKNVSE